ncbi:MAG TPA: response regulator [Pyrinomonadaceae bacterium]|jgi:DNA-binding response OmpR family regulator|nr:response regulator [Pyrinomonadaceae bacterium]
MTEPAANESTAHDANEHATHDAGEHATPDANDRATPDAGRGEARRALLVAEDGASVEALRESLAAIGFEIERVSAEEGARRAAEVKLSVVLIAFGSREGESRLVTLARRLRMEPKSFALPVIFLFRADERTLRSAALRVGADDYFSQDAPREELHARLESLFWRVEAGRRSAPAVAEQRDEIDNFIFLLDSVAADARAGLNGTLALFETRAANPFGTDADGARARDEVSARAHVEAGAGDLPTAEDEQRTLAAAHGFLKLNLRRVDALAFYGPATLLAYLPGADSAAARAAIAALRAEFLSATPGGDLYAGLSSFPADAAEVEQLVEQAEAALTRAREENSTERVFVYVGEGGPADSEARTRRLIASETARATNAPRGEAVGRLRESPPGVAGARELKAGDGRGAALGVAVSAASSGARRAGGKIRRLMLVVSDAARMAQVNLLLRSEGFEVRAAFDAVHALNLLRIDRPDLLLVDYELKGLDGAEMLRRLAKQSGAGPTPPALVLVPAGREDLRREAREAGARRTVDLPYDPVELLDALRAFGDAE